MKEPELLQIIIAIITLFIVIGFKDMLDFNGIGLGVAIIFAFAIIVLSISSKKIIGRWLDAEVEHKILSWWRFGIKPHWHIKGKVPIGVILPIFVTAISIGTIQLMTILSYEPTALKRRAAKRHGYYSFAEMTDWHNSLIGAAGIIIILALSLVSYFIPGLEPLARISAFYAFWNMLPLSKLDGAQIYFGSRILWYALAIITLVFTAYAILLP